MTGTKLRDKMYMSEAAGSDQGRGAQSFLFAASRDSLQSDTGVENLER
jgi:hypothetical protein